MADTSATQDAWTHDQMTLRRRARRRLVGAVAIALAAVLILPMLFDPEPRPLGPEVDIRIPAPSTPFEMAPAAESLVPLPRDVNEPLTQAAEPTLPAPPASGPDTAKSPPQAGAVPEEAPAASAPVRAPEKPADPAAEKAARMAAQKAAEKAAAEARAAEKLLAEKKAADKAAAKEAAAREAAAREAAKPPLAKPTGAFASQGFYLQLGVFASASNAQQLQEKVAAAGFKVELADSNGQYRVRVGPIPERDRALEVQVRLKGKGFTSIILGP